MVSHRPSALSTPEPTSCEQTAYPPRNAPMGLRAGSGAASAYRRGADVWKVLRAAKLAEESARAPEEKALDAIFANDVWVRGCEVWKSREGDSCRWFGELLGSLDVTFPGIVSPSTGCTVGKVDQWPDC